MTSFLRPSEPNFRDRQLQGSNFGAPKPNVDDLSKLQLPGRDLEKSWLGRLVCGRALGRTAAYPGESGEPEYDVLEEKTQCLL